MLFLHPGLCCTFSVASCPRGTGDPRLGAQGTQVKAQPDQGPSCSLQRCPGGLPSLLHSQRLRELGWGALGRT